MLQGPVTINMIAVFEVPKSWPKWKKQKALNGKMSHTSKPDASNLLKNGEDVFNGIVYRDDAQICRGQFAKFYGISPSMLFIVKPIEEVAG